MSISWRPLAEVVAVGTDGVEAAPYKPVGLKFYKNTDTKYVTLGAADILHWNLTLGGKKGKKAEGKLRLL